METKLGANSSLFNASVLETSPQSNNSILIMSCEYASLGKKPPWYGDEMTIQQWSMLKMPIGSRTDTDAILTRQDGYTYDFVLDYIANELKELNSEYKIA